MKITPIGIDINEDAINNFYKTYQDRKCAKFCKETNFQTGHISYEDGVFLPDGTCVLIKENNKKDILGKIFHFKNSTQDINNTIPDGTAIVNVFYDLNLSNKREDIDNNLIICFIHKNILLNHDNKEKYLQVVSCEIKDEDKWEFVKIKYGNPDTKMYYMNGWKYYDGNVYEKKDILSNKANYNKINKTVVLHEDNYILAKDTNVEHKIKPKVFLVPDEEECIAMYIFLLFLSSIFKIRFLLWTISTIWFLIKRKELRDKYNG